MDALRLVCPLKSVSTKKIEHLAFAFLVPNKRNGNEDGRNELQKKKQLDRRADEPSEA